MSDYWYDRFWKLRVRLVVLANKAADPAKKAYWWKHYYKLYEMVRQADAEYRRPV